MGKQFGWGRFLVIALPVSILTFILDVVFHKTAAPAPKKPAAKKGK